MNQAQSKQQKFVAAGSRRAAPYSGGVAWEELPSPALGPASRKAAEAEAADSELPAPASVVLPWDDTLPAGLDEPAPSPPSVFREVLDGLATREVTEPDVFRHFFGNPAPR